MGAGSGSSPRASFTLKWTARLPSFCRVNWKLDSGSACDTLMANTTGDKVRYPAGRSKSAFTALSSMTVTARVRLPHPA